MQVRARIHETIESLRIQLTKHSNVGLAMPDAKGTKGRYRLLYRGRYAPKYIHTHNSATRIWIYMNVVLNESTWKELHEAYNAGAPKHITISLEDVIITNN